MILASILLVAAWMAYFFLLSLYKEDNSVVDLAWGPGFLIVALAGLIAAGTYTARELVVTLMIALWSARLFTHIWIRRQGKGEDWRYQQWREQWKHVKLRSFLQVYVLQGVILLLVVAPIFFIMGRSGAGLYPMDIVGIAVWLAGFLFETIGDYQLYDFKRDPKNKGKIMKTGLWKYTRHPNYFGEALLWWGVYLIALNTPNGWASLYGPALLTYSLLRVSGVTMLEAKYSKNKEYNEYQRTTSAFIPWPPKK